MFNWYVKRIRNFFKNYLARKISTCLEALLGISELKSYREFACKVEGFLEYVCVIENTCT